MSCNVPPFLRKIGGSVNGVGGRKRPSSQEKGVGGGGRGRGGEIFKASYSVFWVSKRRGISQPHSMSKVIDCIQVSMSLSRRVRD